VHSTSPSAVEQSLPSRAAEDPIRGRCRIRVRRSGVRRRLQGSPRRVPLPRDRRSGTRAGRGEWGAGRAAGALWTRVVPSSAGTGLPVAARPHLRESCAPPGTGPNALVSRRACKAGGQSRMAPIRWNAHHPLWTSPLRWWWSWRTTDAGESPSLSSDRLSAPLDDSHTDQDRRTKQALGPARTAIVCSRSCVLSCSPTVRSPCGVPELDHCC
jgi:hypothetical protein